MKLDLVYWISPTQLAELAAHKVVTLEQLASLELRDSFADAIPVPGLHKMARRARRSLGHVDPLSMIGAAVGQRGPVVYAGGVTYDDSEDG